MSCLRFGINRESLSWVVVLIDGNFVQLVQIIHFAILNELVFSVQLV